ncbi:hypothetical protein Btru_000225 [Bulinus truncatus]|nr:hypothetical protein Btru_000225 [Bulinus truncatus]
MNDCLKAFSDNPTLRSSIMMLTRQYRMHPEILSLPNQLFYDGKLETDMTVYNRQQLLTPYLVFDIKASKELNSDRSISNVPEAICTAQLCLAVMKVLKKTKETIDKHIGIICPYAEQRQTILEQLRFSELEKIEVNTVDGYQGKEKEVIIMSCVRAQSHPTSIGFLADKRRMNVALTRAKYAMYVLGHFDTLKMNGLWAELQEDAQERNLVVPVAYVTDFFKTAESRITLAK